MIREGVVGRGGRGGEGGGNSSKNTSEHLPTNGGFQLIKQLHSRLLAY